MTFCFTSSYRKKIIKKPDGANSFVGSVPTIDCKKDGRRISSSFHYRKVKSKDLSMAVAILRKWRHLEPEFAQ